MISEKFVRIAREVIAFIKAGNRLDRKSIFYSKNTKSACALGAVLWNHKIETLQPYQITENILNWKFSVGFTAGFDSISYNKFYKINPNPDYDIGFSLSKMCEKRGWFI
jgi:hypothetical protein